MNRTAALIAVYATLLMLAWLAWCAWRGFDPALCDAYQTCQWRRA